MKKDLWSICLAIYRQLYREAKPSADFDELVASGKAKRPNFFMDYYLDQDRQDRIIARHCAGLRPDQKAAVMKEVYLGCAPTGARGQ